MGIDANNINTSENSRLELVKQGTALATVTSDTSVTTQVAHNLGFTPIALCYTVGGSPQSLLQQLPTPTNVQVDTSDDKLNFQRYIQCATDSTYLYLIVSDALGTGATTINVAYFLYRLTAD